MPQSSEKQDDQDPISSLQRAADQHINEILERRKAAVESRAAALAGHSEPLTLKTQLIRGITLDDVVATKPFVNTSSLQTVGYLLAIGDSWFDYPIRDVLTNLDDHFAYNIESAAHKGDAIETMVSHLGQLDKFARNLDKIISLGFVPKAVLLSGGGNDIAGTHFDLFINNIDLKLDALNEQVVAGVVDTRLAAAYRLMFLSINGLCQARLGRTVPILIHGYDHPVPDGRGFLGGWGPLPGPWLKPGFDQKLYPNVPDNVALMTTLIDRFNAMLQRVAQEPTAGDVSVRRYPRNTIERTSQLSAILGQRTASHRRQSARSQGRRVPSYRAEIRCSAPTTPISNRLSWISRCIYAPHEIAEERESN